MNRQTLTFHAGSRFRERMPSLAQTAPKADDVVSAKTRRGEAGEVATESFFAL
jgi:hypothetical protein